MRASAIKTAIVAAPFLAIVLLLRLLGPALWGRGAEREFATLWVGERVEVHGDPETGFGDALGKPTEAFLDALEHTYGARWGLRPERRRTVILWFATDEDFLRYAGPGLQPDLVRAGGYYDSGDGRIALVSGRDPLADRRGLRHEAVHMAMDRWLPHQKGGLPMWLEEGLAVSLEDSVPLPDGTLRHAFPRGLWLRRLGREGGWLGSRDVLSLRPAAFRERGNARAYAASALLVGYLLHGSGAGGGAALDEVIHLGQRGIPITAPALEGAVGSPLAAWEAAWRRWAEGAAGDP